ncbi:polyprenyl synthetase domain-containing protein [Hirsutella rhossiliensis]|uniref:Polyprenyl synthetase domain-containing protein n=1 Tax=Hirsutella rhossiliensis TaxID=111463 RepID=A0A9P8MTF8_9HYPO|nr:polyprenyl synthetase domain-containing protein [Hirsutella rhossiliensis]KAH0960970.1 polyprenyl synthetase domain-containing protein [Hirsutella rhossiliensis]
MPPPFLKMMDVIKDRIGISDVATLFVAFSIGFLAKGSAKLKPASTQPVEQFGYCKELPAKRSKPEDTECPYEYLVKLYGKHHFEPFVREFRPALEKEDPVKYTLILDIMDAVHFALILVDDISDNSRQRKNQPTAHLIYGASETANRAYLVLTTVINRALRERPVLGVELMKALENILQGQDMSLVWRRDGLESFQYQGDERIRAYKNMALLKTGTLFILLGRLLNDGGEELDDLMTRFGWYAQLQNDCKNIYSTEYVTSKGAVAEDVRNGELSFPIVVALNEEDCGPIMQRALESHTEKDIEAALDALQTERVREACLKALKEAGRGLDKFVGLWGRREQMQTGSLG